MKKLLILTLALILGGCAGGLSASIWTPASAGGVAGEELNLIPGTFTGVGSGGYGGDIVVEVVVDEDSMFTITVVDHGETPIFADPAFDSMIPAMENTNSTGVDLQTGATFTSRALIAAVEDALLQAGADLDTLRAAGRGAGLRTFVPGIYTGYGPGGFGGSIVVEVVFDTNAIREITVVSHSESPGFAESTFDFLTGRILAQNSTDMDTVGSATLTSAAFLWAVEDAITQAVADPNAEMVFDIDGDVRTYIGVGEGYYGPMTVQITVDAADPTNILAVNVLEHADTDIFANLAFDMLIPMIIATNSADLDTVGSVTYSSRGLLEGAAHAIAQASGEAEVTPGENEDEPADEFTFPTPPITRFTPGTYTASAQGYMGSVNLSVVFEEDRIVSITIISHTDTPIFFDLAEATIIPRILEAQGTNISAVGTGATYSSQAILNAVSNAISQAAN